MCRAMGSLFREKLDLPIEEEHDDHLYENVVPLTPSSDSDSDCVTAPSFGTEKPSHQAIKAKETSRAAKNKTGKFFTLSCFARNIRDLKIGVYGKQLTSSTFFPIKSKSWTVKC